MIIKCKMCGGDLNIQEGNPICECEFCGTQQTVPLIDDEKKVNLFNRANRLRMSAEFDKASTVYASIVAEFPEEAEAYWGLCLCKYGIEYVDDPQTGKKIPTCHRTLSESIMDDDDFEQACENTDPVTKRFYREEAKVIDQLQRRILDIVSKEDPYDVFVCYKETDENGDRTEDSVLAQDIYDTLTDKGLKVFFARITLEDKLGQEYEPYIYSALHSAKVMLAIGTKYEYYDAVWVKNEWARFLDMMKADRTKVLIPCYKNLDAYDIPKEFKNLQAQDMGKIGWQQDLIRGVMKICGDSEIESIDAQSSFSIKNKLERGYIYLEDQLWTEAKKQFESIFDIDAKCAEAYLGMALAEMKYTSKEIFEQSYPYFNVSNNNNLKRSKEYSKGKLAKWFNKLDEDLKEYREKQFIRRRQDPEIKEKTDYIAKIRDRNRKVEGLIVTNEDSNNKIVDVYGLTANGTIVSTSSMSYGWNVRDWKNLLWLYGDLHLGIVGIKTDGTVVSDSPWRITPDKWNNVSKLSVGLTSVVGLKNNGTVITHDREEFEEKYHQYYGECDVEKWKDIVSVYSGELCIVGIKADGHTVVAGCPDMKMIREISSWNDIVDISISSGHVAGLKSDGSVVVSGIQEFYNEFHVQGWSNIIEIQTRDTATIGLKDNGEVVAVGKNDSGQCDVSSWNNIVSIRTSCFDTFGLRADGSVVTTDKTIKVDHWRNVVAIYPEAFFIVGLCADGTVVYSGCNCRSNQPKGLSNIKLFKNIDTIEQEGIFRLRKKICDD